MMSVVYLSECQKEKKICHVSNNAAVLQQSKFFADSSFAHAFHDLKFRVQNFFFNETIKRVVKHFFFLSSLIILWYKILL